VDKKLQGIKRIMYLIPVLICVTFSLAMVIQYTAVPVESTEAFEEAGGPENGELDSRGKEILEQYQRQEISLLKTMDKVTG
jgi:hypothetical protein